MIAISGFTYFAKTGVTSSWATFFFFFQILLNAIWSPLFFWKKWITVALVDLGLLWGAVATTIYLFSEESTTAACLLVPYNIWLTLAFYLNLYIVIFKFFYYFWSSSFCLSSISVFFQIALHLSNLAIIG